MHKIIRTINVLVIGLALLSSATIASADNTGSGAMSRKLLLENNVDLSSKAINTKVIKVNFPVGYTTPKHTHEGPGPRFVSKGQVRVIEGDKTNTYNAGDVFWESGALMSVENVGKTEAELIIFELVPTH